MKIKNYICATFVFIALNTFAQTSNNWHKGFIIQDNKQQNKMEDTLRGEVLYDGWQNTPSTISFRLEPTAAAQTFTVADCSAFGVNSFAKNWAYCKRFQVDLEISETDLNVINQKKQPEYTAKTMFLRAVCIGSSANLWAYNTNYRAHLFLQMGNANPLQLVKKQYYTDENRNVLATNAMYRQQLATTLVGCKKTPNWANVLYSEPEIANIVENYNNCVGSNDYRTKMEQITVDCGVVAGLGLASLAVPGYKTFYFLPTTFPPGLAYTAGLYVNLVLPRSNEHWSIYNDLMLSAYVITRNDVLDNPYNYKLKQALTTSIAGTYISLNTMARYTFRIGENRLYAGAGITNAYALDITHRMVYDYVGLQGGPTVEEKPYLSGGKDAVRYYTQGLVAEIGFKYKKRFGVAARWQYTNGFSNSYTSNTIFNYGYLLGTYSF